MKKKAPCVDMKTDMVKDERFVLLGELGGYNRYEAWGRMFALWAWCTDRGLQDAPDDSDGYVVSDAIVTRFLGSSGVVAILADGCDELALAERHGDGRVYLRGTSEYVTARRSRTATAHAGGKARERGASRETGRFVSTPTNVQPDSSRHPAGSPAARQPTPAPSSSPSSSSSDPDHEDQGETAIVRVPILGLPHRLDSKRIAEGWTPSDTEANSAAATKANARGVLIAYALDKFGEQMRAAGKTSTDWDASWRAYLTTELPTPQAIRDGYTRVEREAVAREQRDRERAQAIEQKQIAEDERAYVRQMLTDWRNGAPQHPDDVAVVRSIQHDTIARALAPDDDEPRCRCGAPPSHGLYEHLCGACGDAEIAAKHASIRALRAGRSPPAAAETRNAASDGTRGVEGNHQGPTAKEATK